MDQDQAITAELRKAAEELSRDFFEQVGTGHQGYALLCLLNNCRELLYRGGRRSWLVRLIDKTRQVKWGDGDVGGLRMLVEVCRAQLQQQRRLDRRSRLSKILAVTMENEDYLAALGKALLIQGDREHRTCLTV